MVTKRRKKPARETAVLESKARWLRATLFDMLARVGQGHPGSILSQIEILVTLFYGGFFSYTRGNPADPDRDRIIVSKGHATMGLYPILADAGYFPAEELDKFGSPGALLRIFGNITIPGVDATSGSLAHGLGIACGMALAARHDGRPSRTFVILSEGEMYEGATWESALFASHHGLDNVVLVIDRNRRIILGDTEDLLRLEPVAQKWESFGWVVTRADGHDFASLSRAFSKIGRTRGKPLVVIADTVKGKGVSLMEHKPEWHYWQGLTPAQIERVRAELRD
jgi:transketolase